MAKLTDVRDTPEIANGAKVIAVPVKGGTTIYQGALVALDASGYAIPGKKAESLTAVGRAEETVTNTGADGELVIRVARGVFVFDNTATSANKITAAHVLKPCYDNILVKSSVTVSQNISVTVTTDTADTDEAVENRVKAILTELLAVRRSRKLNELTLSDINHAIRSGYSGATNAAVSEPEADVKLGKDKVITLGDVSVTVERE